MHIQHPIKMPNVLSRRRFCLVLWTQPNVGQICSPHLYGGRCNKLQPGPGDYTGRFIMFSVITNIYNKKTKGPTLMEFFTVARELKKFFFGNYRCSMCAPRVTRHTSIRYSSCCHTSVNIFDACVATT